ncbi:MAG TPA: hypothetical protein VL961_13390 [Acidimicrobiales bacterium]|nr:hypothetical protein [Acidimicrobiales bacterium]
MDQTRLHEPADDVARRHRRARHVLDLSATGRGDHYAGLDH